MSERSGRGRSKKKNTTQGCFFFFCSGPGERQGKEKPRAGTGPEQKKEHHPGCFFFFLAAAPAKGKRRRSPVGRRHGARAKKTPPRCFFFCSGPGERQGKEKPRWAAGTARKKNLETNDAGHEAKRGHNKKKDTLAGFRVQGFRVYL